MTRYSRRNNPEHEHQKALFTWARLRTPHQPELGNLFAIPNGARTSLSVAKRLKAEGLKAGVPDVFLAVPARGKAGLFIELKAGKNKPSKEQAIWLQKLSAWGYMCAVCYSWTEARDLIERYLRAV